MKEFVFVVAGAAAILAFAVWLAKMETGKWEAFSAAHACRVVAQIRGHSDPVTGFDSKGNIVFSTVTTPDQTGYLCNDGVTYYR